MICLYKHMSRPRVDDQELTARAIRAYYVAARKELEQHGIPADMDETIVGSPSNDSSVHELDDKYYVILRNATGILAVYRVRNDGMLKRLKRWPEDLDRY